MPSRHITAPLSMVKNPAAKLELERNEDCYTVLPLCKSQSCVRPRQYQTPIPDDTNPRPTSRRTKPNRHKQKSAHWVEVDPRGSKVQRIGTISKEGSETALRVTGGDELRSSASLASGGETTRWRDKRVACSQRTIQQGARCEPSSTAVRSVAVPVAHPDAGLRRPGLVIPPNAISVRRTRHTAGRQTTPPIALPAGQPVKLPNSKSLHKTQLPPRHDSQQPCPVDGTTAKAAASIVYRMHLKRWTKMLAGHWVTRATMICAGLNCETLHCQDNEARTHRSRGRPVRHDVSNQPLLPTRRRGSYPAAVAQRVQRRSAHNAVNCTETAISRIQVHVYGEGTGRPSFLARGAACEREEPLDHNVTEFRCSRL